MENIQTKLLYQNSKSINLMSFLTLVIKLKHFSLEVNRRCRSVNRKTVYAGRKNKYHMFHSRSVYAESKNKDSLFLSLIKKFSDKVHSAASRNAFYPQIFLLLMSENSDQFSASR